MLEFVVIRGNSCFPFNGRYMLDNFPSVCKRTDCANSVTQGTSTVDRARSTFDLVTRTVRSFVAQGPPSMQIRSNAPYDIGGSAPQPFASEVTQQASVAMHMGVHERHGNATLIPTMVGNPFDQRTSAYPSLNSRERFTVEPPSPTQVPAKRSREVFEAGGLEHILWNSNDDIDDEVVDESSDEFGDGEPVTGASLSRAVNEQSVVRVGQEFTNIADLRKVVADDEVKKKYEFGIVKSDPTRIKSLTTHCWGGVSKLSKKVVNAAWVSRWIEPRLRDKPDHSHVDIVKDIYRQHGVVIKYRLAWFAKEVAKARIVGLDDDGFHNLRMYCVEVQHSNPGSRAFVQAEDGCQRFKRMFYALEACVAGFMHYRPLLGLDGTFLKTRYKGILLSATTVDAEGHLFPVASAIVPGEDNDNWFWFLHHLSATIQSRATNEIITFLSDRDKGLIDAVTDVFLRSPHGYCMRHLSENVKKRNKGPEYQKLLWATSKADTFAKFDNLVAHMRAMDPDTTTWLLRMCDPVHWAEAHFEGRPEGAVSRPSFVCQVLAQYQSLVPMPAARWTVVEPPRLCWYARVVP
ncbi:hypothetical protein CBR_g4374 [Chara braunii]|uniref:MULE transposase domain-containing protein n=1 Tax=Chara braunii TaxID=69332 RepID=A0A388KHL8_CHABU|nr:hypothetical protein CBR_g4374 [Chara braunii]|eukprot:GBG69539.1 hypothetical protein CBR_g4374 [Chara braunii]